MKTTTLFAAALLAAPGLLLAQATSPAPAAATTPQSCFASLGQHQKDAMAAAQAAGTPVNGAALKQEMTTLAKRCLATVDTSHLDRMSAIQLGLVNMVAGDSSAAIAMFDRAADDTSGTPAQRAEGMLAIIRATAATPHADGYLAALDAIPNVTLQRFLARRMLMGYYLNYDIDDKLEAAAHTMLTLARTMPADQQREQAPAILESYRSLAALYANRLHPET
jgi:hypothetical protein